MPTPPARPPVLLYVCIFLGVGSTLVLLELVDALSSWGSVEMQDAVRDTLAQEPFTSTDITVTQAMGWLRVLAYVGVVVSTAGAVFSVYTVRGHNTSRIMLTVLCGLSALLFASGGLVGLLPAVAAMMSASLLWSPDVRRWFRAVGGKEVEPVGAASGPSGLGGSPASSPGRTSQPDPFAPGATTGRDTLTAPAPVPPPPPLAARAPDERPRPVRIALGFTMVPSAMALLLGGFMLLAVTVGGDSLRTSMDEPGVLRELLAASDTTVDEMLDLVLVVSILWVVLSVVALAAAAAASRRSRAGRTLVLVCAVLTLPLSALALPFGVATGAAAVVVIAQLLKPEAKAWFAA